VRWQDGDCQEKRQARRHSQAANREPSPTHQPPSHCRGVPVCQFCQTSARRHRSAFPPTETELDAMAALPSTEWPIPSRRYSPHRSAGLPSTRRAAPTCQQGRRTHLVPMRDLMHESGGD
jgi:hypothetical protein